jgi:hypothetical protein
MDGNQEHLAPRPWIHGRRIVSDLVCPLWGFSVNDVSRRSALYSVKGELQRGFYTFLSSSSCSRFYSSITNKPDSVAFLILLAGPRRCFLQICSLIELEQKANEWFKKYPVISFACNLIFDRSKTDLVAYSYLPLNINTHLIPSVDC